MSEVIAVRVPKETKQKLEFVAQQHGLTIGELLRNIVDAFLTNPELQNEVELEEDTGVNTEPCALRCEVCRLSWMTPISRETKYDVNKLKEGRCPLCGNELYVVFRRRGQLKQIPFTKYQGELALAFRE